MWDLICRAPLVRIDRLLQESAHRYPNKTAVVCGDNRVSYAELERRANCLAHAIRDRGVRRGDRIIIFLDNCIEAIIAIFATLKADATFVVVNHSTKADKLAFIFGT